MGTSVGTSLPLLAAVVCVLLIAGYWFYGRFLARQFSLRDDVRTPAHELEDGEDDVPTPRFYLLGQHFSAIAAAGPIVGPITAAQQFGWLPCVLWIGLGYVILAFTDVTAATFIGVSEELSGLDGVPVAFNKGGAVAAAAVMYLLLAVVMGLVQRRFKPPLWLVTAIFVPGTLAAFFAFESARTLLRLADPTDR